MRSLSTRYDIVLGPIGLQLWGPQIDGVESVIDDVRVYSTVPGSPAWAMLGDRGRHQIQRPIPRSAWPKSVVYEIAEDLPELAK